MHVNEILALFQEYVDEPESDSDTGDYPPASSIQFINSEHKHLFSVVRQLYEDWFGREHIFLTVTGTNKYLLPRDALGIRRVELITSGVTTVTDSSVSPSYVYFTIDEINAAISEVSPLDLNTKDGINYNITNNRFRSLEGYYLYDDYIKFAEGTTLGGSTYCRVFYTPTAPDLHKGVALGGGSDYLDLALSSTETTLGPVRNIDKYYVGCYVEIMSGTGAGQIRKVLRHDPVSARIWIDGTWTTNPNSTSSYSIVSPIKEDFHELIALGAAMRAKGIKTEDDTTVLGQMYAVIKTDLISALESRIEQCSRRVRRTSRYII